ncbi:MAG: ATP synthase subunit I [Candidatus Eremiobacteraeota bacterium]|nr:ATP synthase subunit I [Candidatus Eremiobacteraeota bacterium]
MREEDASAPGKQSPAATGARSLLLVLLIAAILAFRSPLAGFSLALGGLCGVLNMALTARGVERLVKRSGVGAFVFSSFLRITVFAIVPVLVALHGPWWTFASYFAGFFAPQVLYVSTVARTLVRK